MNQLLTNIQRLLKPEDKAENPDEKTTSTAAHPADEEAEPLHVGKRRIKENYTSHWDLDYLPRAEVDRILGDISADKQDDEFKPT
jgi:hypothetical protein